MRTHIKIMPGIVLTLAGLRSADLQEAEEQAAFAVAAVALGLARVQTLPDTLTDMSDLQQQNQLADIIAARVLCIQRLVSWTGVRGEIGDAQLPVTVEAINGVFLMPEVAGSFMHAVRALFMAQRGTA